MAAQAIENQQYPPPPGPPKAGPYGGFNNGAPTGPPPSYDDIFRISDPRWHDLWAGALFLLTCAGFVAVSALSIHGYASNRDSNPGGLRGSNGFGLSTNTLYLFLWVLLAAIVLSYVYIWLARLFTKQFIWITGILNIAFSVATAAYMLYKHYWSGGIVFAIFAIFSIVAFITWIPRIPFSALMLQTAVDVSRHFGHVYLVSAVGGLAGAIFGGWYATTLVAVYVKYQPNDGGDPAAVNAACQGNCSWAKVTGLVIFVTFAGYWISEWLKNTIHVTISGVYGSWYFSARHYPTRVTRGALRRALTYSFGSISLGSLVVAMINMLRQLCSVAQSQSAQDGDMIGYALFCILGCLIDLLDWAVQFINRYAFSHIALYGKAYIPAAKDTWRMIKDRGIDALVNECLIGPVLSMGATFVAYACGLLAYLYMIYVHSISSSSSNNNNNNNNKDQLTPVVVGFAFVIGLQVCNVFTTPLSSGIDTIFVAMAWDPEVMMRDHPDLYQRMVHVYPQVQQAIHA